MPARSLALTCRWCRDLVLEPLQRGAGTGHLLYTPASAAFASAARLEWALSAGLPSKHVCVLAASQGNLPMLEHALAQGLPCTPAAAHAAVFSLYKTIDGRFSHAILPGYREEAQSRNTHEPGEYCVAYDMTDDERQRMVDRLIRVIDLLDTLGLFRDYYPLGPHREDDEYPDPQVERDRPPGRRRAPSCSRGRT